MCVIESGLVFLEEKVCHGELLKKYTERGEACLLSRRLIIYPQVNSSSH